MDSDERTLREKELQQREFAERFNAALETWRFQINSQWTRSSYYAISEAGAFAAVWQVFDHHYYKVACAICIFGIVLSTLWFLNNRAMHIFAGDWFQRVMDIEVEFNVCPKRQLVEGYDKRARRYHVVPYEWLDLSLPTLFVVGWVGMLFWCFWQVCRSSLS